MLSAWTTPEKRNDLAQRLKTAGCEVDTSGTDSLKAGDFTAPKVADGPIGRRIPGAAPTKRRHPGTRPIIIHPAAVDESMASVVETRGHTAVGERDSERLPRVGNDKNVSGNGKTRDSTLDDPVSAGRIIRMPRAERIFRDSLHEN